MNCSARSADDGGHSTQVNANYDRVVADRAILGLTTELEWMSDVLGGASTKVGSKLRAGDAAPVWLDTWLANEMLRLSELAGAAYQTMKFKEALKIGFYGMQEARDRYRTGTATVGLSAPLVRRWIEWQALMMAPIIPHWSEAVWEMLGKEGLIVHARWPGIAGAKEDAAITAAGNYLFDVSHHLASALANRDKKKPKKGAEPASTEKPNQVNLYVARAFPLLIIITELLIIIR